jgi:hypothetical protein
LGIVVAVTKRHEVGAKATSKNGKVKGETLEKVSSLPTAKTESEVKAES